MTKQQLAQLMADNPGLSDDQLVALAQSQRVNDGGILDTAKRWYEAASKPIFGQDSYSGMALPETGYKVVDVPAKILQAMTSPLDVATFALGGGALAAGAKGLTSASRALKLAEIGSILPHGVAGAAKVATADDPYEKAGGALQAAMSLAGAGMASRGLRAASQPRGVASVGATREAVSKAAAPAAASNLDVLLGSVPEQMLAHQKGGGSTFGRFGNAAGRDLYSVGGVVPSKVVPAGEFNEDILRAFISSNKAALENPARHVGTWANEGNVHLDITDLLPRQAAEEMMRARNEKAIFGLKNFDEVSNPQFAAPKAVAPNASGESMASQEAINRMASMKQRGEQFVVRKGGVTRPLTGPEAVDYVPRAGEQYGVLDAQGRFRLLQSGQAGRGHTAFGIASPAAGMTVQELARDPETGEVPEWAKVAALVGNVGGMAGLGMAAMRKTAMRPTEAAKREVASDLFMKKGDISSVEGPALEALAGSDKDRALQQGVAIFQKLKQGADPELFTPEKQRGLVEVGLKAGKENWYRDWDKWAKQNIHPDDRKLVADLLALTSTQTTPYDNVNRMFNTLYKVKAGQTPQQVGKGLGLARKSVERYLTEGAIPGRKHYSFSQNLQGIFEPVTADSQAGRGVGLLPWEANALVKQKSGAHILQRGAFVGPEQRLNIQSVPAQGRGGLTSNEYNLVEDLMRRLAPEYGLDPAQTQAAHWFGSLQDVVTPRLAGEGRVGGGRNIPAYQRDPYNLQLERRFERAGVTPGEPLTLDKLAWLVKVIQKSKGKGEKFTGEALLF